MNQRGVALAAALLVVLLGGVLLTISMTWAITEIRAGEAWSVRGRAETAAASSLAIGLPTLHLQLDTVPPGTRVQLASDTLPGMAGSIITAMPLGDSLVLLEAIGQGRATVTVGLLTRLRADSQGVRPVGFRPRFHPLP